MSTNAAVLGNKWMTIGMMQRADQLCTMVEMLGATMEELVEQMENLGCSMEALQEATESIQENIDELTFMMEHGVDSKPMCVSDTSADGTKGDNPWF